MTSRRRLLASVGSAAIVATAGCLGGSGGPSGNGTSSGGDGTPGDVKKTRGQIAGVTADGTAVSISVRDSSKVEAINVINEGGEHVGSESVATGASQVSFSFLEEDIAYGGYRSKPTGEYRFVAVDGEDKQVGEADFVYKPAIELADASTGAEKYPDEEESSKWLVLSVTNTGTAPGVFDGMQFTYLPEKDVNNVGSDGQTLPRFIQGEGTQDGKYARGSLDTLEELDGKEKIDQHVLEPGETRQFIKQGFFESREENADTDGVESCDFERSFTLRLFSTPAKKERTMHEVTAKLTGDLGVETGFGSVSYWCGSPGITAVEATESNSE